MLNFEGGKIAIIKGEMEKLRKNRKQNKLILSGSWIITMAASVLYTVLPLFSEGRKWTHPSGMPHIHKSPDSEILIVFDSVSVTLGILSAISTDYFLMVFLSLVLVQLTHLKETLAEMVNEISVDEEGNVVYKSGRRQPVEDLKISGDISYMLNITRCVRSQKKRPPELVTKDFEYERCIRKFEDKLRIWIRQHQQTIRFFQKVKNIFSIMASVHLLYVVFYTCFTSVHLAQTKPGKDTLFLPIAVLGGLMSLFVWCRIGYYLEFIGSQLFGDAFERAWYLYPNKIQKAFFMIILTGQQNPLVLKGLSLVKINLINFTQVLRITYELFACLLHVVRDE